MQQYAKKILYIGYSLPPFPHDNFLFVSCSFLNEAKNLSPFFKQKQHLPF